MYGLGFKVYGVGQQPSHNPRVWLGKSVILKSTICVFCEGWYDPGLYSGVNLTRHSVSTCRIEYGSTLRNAVIRLTPGLDRPLLVRESMRGVGLGGRTNQSATHCPLGVDEVFSVAGVSVELLGPDSEFMFRVLLQS